MSFDNVCMGYIGKKKEPKNKQNPPLSTVAYQETCVDLQHLNSKQQCPTHNLQQHRRKGIFQSIQGFKDPVKHYKNFLLFPYFLVNTMRLKKLFLSLTKRHSRQQILYLTVLAHTDKIQIDCQNDFLIMHRFAPKQKPTDCFHEIVFPTPQVFRILTTSLKISAATA